jgi:hypothetical protein
MQIGLIAGGGELPLIVTRDAREQGYRVVTVALEDIAPAGLNELSDEIRWVNPGKFGELIETLKARNVRKAIMAGKVSKSLLYKSKVLPDMRAVKLLFSLKDRSDDSILKAITEELRGEGIEVIDIASFSPHLLTPEGPLTRKRPSQEQWKDIAYGWRIAKQIGLLDIGQTVVVKDRAVLAVEAIEGTDEAIRRAGQWSDGGAVVVKVSKPHQDMRLDVPVVGSTTLATMIEARASVLAIEAFRSMILNRQALLTEAEEAGIAVVGVTDGAFPAERPLGSTRT